MTPVARSEVTDNLLTPAEAVRRLPPYPYPVHVWAGGLGADWDRDDAIEMIARSPSRRVVRTWLGQMLEVFEDGRRLHVDMDGAVTR